MNSARRSLFLGMFEQSQALKYNLTLNQAINSDTKQGEKLDFACAQTEARPPWGTGLRIEEV